MMNASPGMDLIHSIRGAAAEIARQLGLNPSAVAQWRRVPAERVLAVEAATGISRHLLRPDLYPTEVTSSLIAEIREIVERKSMRG